MGEKKELKVKLSTVILLFVILILIIALGVVYYLGFIKKDNINQNINMISTNNTVKETAETNTNIQQNTETTNNQQNNTETTNNQQNNTETNQTAQKDNSKNIIMYDGTNIVNAKPGLYYTLYEENQYPDFYNTTYDIFEDGKNIGKTKGAVKSFFSDLFEDTCYYIDYESEKNGNSTIHVSCNYDVIPRKYEDISNIPSAIKDEFHMADSLKMRGIDLDGDGKKEYIVVYSYKNESAREYVSGIYLFNENYKKISMIARQSNFIDLSDFNNIQFIDIDADGNMEIIVSIPMHTEEGRFGIYKYENNGIQGPIDSY